MEAAVKPDELHSGFNSGRNLEKGPNRRKGLESQFFPQLPPHGFKISFTGVEMAAAGTVPTTRSGILQKRSVLEKNPALIKQPDVDRPVAQSSGMDKATRLSADHTIKRIDDIENLLGILGGFTHDQSGGSGSTSGGRKYWDSLP